MGGRIGTSGIEREGRKGRMGRTGRGGAGATAPAAAAEGGACGTVGGGGEGDGELVGSEDSSIGDAAGATIDRATFGLMFDLCSCSISPSSFRCSRREYWNGCWKIGGSSGGGGTAARGFFLAAERTGTECAGGDGEDSASIGVDELAAGMSSAVFISSS
jgi:hypothetical protein